MKVFEAIKIGSNLLKEKKITSHVIDSEILLSKILDKSREEVLINPDQMPISLKKSYQKMEPKFI